MGNFLIAGASLPLWQPDEEIFASRLNINERRYGGQYFSDEIGFGTGLPVFNVVTGGIKYGQLNKKYGFSLYISNPFEDDVNIQDQTPIFTVTSPYSQYGNTEYSFFSYGNTNITEDSFNLSDQTPVFVSGNPYYIYGSGTNEYGLTMYGVQNPIIDTLNIADQTPSFLIKIVNTNVYGTGNKYGFSVWQ